LQTLSKYSAIVFRKVILSVLLSVFFGQVFANSATNISADVANHTVLKATTENATQTNWFCFENLQEEEVDGEDDSDEDFSSPSLVPDLFLFLFGNAPTILHGQPNTSIVLQKSNDRLYILFHSLKLDC
jgi:hypothetical protein